MQTVRYCGALSYRGISIYHSPLLKAQGPCGRERRKCFPWSFPSETVSSGHDEPTVLMDSAVVAAQEQASQHMEEKGSRRARC